MLSHFNHYLFSIYWVPGLGTDSKVWVSAQCRRPTPSFPSLPPKSHLILSPPGTMSSRMTETKTFGQEFFNVLLIYKKVTNIYIYIYIYIYANIISKGQPNDSWMIIISSLTHRDLFQGRCVQKQAELLSPVWVKMTRMTISFFFMKYSWFKTY